MTNYVRVMCDYCADGLWSEDGAAHPDDYPITPALKARIAAWQDEFERAASIDRGMSREVLLAFNAEGRAIAVEMKLQLPDWTVVFFDSVRVWETSGGGDRDRAYFEYPIDASGLLEPCPDGWSTWMIEDPAGIGVDWCAAQLPPDRWKLVVAEKGWAAVRFAPGADALFRLFRGDKVPMRPVALPNRSSSPPSSWMP